MEKACDTVESSGCYPTRIDSTVYLFSYIELDCGSRHVVGGNVRGVGRVDCGTHAIYLFDLYEFSTGDVYLSE